MIGIREIPLLFVLVLAPCSLLRADDDGLAHLQFMVADDAGQLVPCRIHVYDSAGEPVLASGQPAWRDHFVCAGEVALELAHGTYRYEIERGPEHQRLSGTVELKEDQTVHVTLSRIADMPVRLVCGRPAHSSPAGRVSATASGGGSAYRPSHHLVESAQSTRRQSARRPAAIY